MSWRDRYRDAELEGVPFFVSDADGEAGRRVQLHEYPQRDRSYPEDLGKKPRRFSFTAYLLGDDVDQHAARLLAVIERAGPKNLVHPWFDAQRIVVLDFRGPRFSEREGGMVRFNLDVVQSGEPVFPAATTNTSHAVVLACDAAQAAAETDFVENFSVLDVPAFVADAAGEYLSDLGDTLGEISARITTLPDAVSGFVHGLNDFTSGISSLILSPAVLGSNIASLFDQVRLIAAEPGAAFDVMADYFIYGNDAPAVPTTTANRQRQAANQTAMRQLVQRTAIIQAARIAAQRDYASFDDAIAVRTLMVDALDTQAETASDAVYESITVLRMTVARDIATRGANLARLVTITLPAALPATVLAWRLYGDADRADEILSRNKLSDGLFVPGGVPLEVLSSA